MDEWTYHHRSRHPRLRRPASYAFVRSWTAQEEARAQARG